MHVFALNHAGWHKSVEDRTVMPNHYSSLHNDNIVLSFQCACDMFLLQISETGLTRINVAMALIIFIKLALSEMFI
jgi:hypothetical protein